MATISTVFTIKDHMTSQLKNMTRGVENLRAQAALTGDTLDFNPGRINAATSAQQNFNREMRKGNDAAKHLTNTIKGMVAAYLGLETAGQALKAFVGISDTLTQIEARLGGIVGEGQALVDTNEQILISAQRARTAYADMADFITRVGFNAKDAFKDMDELTTFAEIVNKQFVLAGTGSREAAMSMIQLSQALASGVLRGEELNSVFEQAPGILQSIAAYMGVPIGQIRAMASEGMLTSEIVKNAVLASAGEVEARFNKMPLTWQQTWNQFTNQVIWGLRPLAQAFREAINTEGFREFMSGLATGISKIAGTMSVVIHYLSEWDYIDEVLKSIAFVAGSLCVAAFTLMGAAAVRTLGSFLGLLVVMSDKLMTGIGNVIRLGLAFTAAHPAILLVVAAIGLVIAGVYLMSNSVEDTIANLAGGFVGLGAVIITALGNAFEWTKVAAVNTFQFIKSAVMNNFVSDIVGGITGAISKVAGALEKVGINTKGLANLHTSFTEFVQPHYIQGNYNSLSDAWHNGVSTGQNFVHDAANALRDPSKIFADMKEQIEAGMNIPGYVPPYVPSDNLDDLTDSSKDTANNTKKLADTLQSIGFDIGLLKASFMDTAMRKIEQNVKLDINMPVTNANDVDLDGFVNEFVTQVQTHLENTSPTMGQTGVRTYAF